MCKLQKAADRTKTDTAIELPRRTSRVCRRASARRRPPPPLPPPGRPPEETGSCPRGRPVQREIARPPIIQISKIYQQHYIMIPIIRVAPRLAVWVREKEGRYLFPLPPSPREKQYSKFKI